MGWRVEFDAEVELSNGGSLRAEKFHLDCPDQDITDETLGVLFTRSLNQVAAAPPRINNKRIFPAPQANSPPTQATKARRVVELSHILHDGMITYPGLPGPRIDDHLSRADSRESYSPGTEFQIGRITMVSNTGTYVDTPFHRFPDGVDLAGVPIDALADLDGVVVTPVRADNGAIELAALAAAADLVAAPDLAGRALLVRTGWDRHWGTDQYFSGHPHLTAAAAAWLVEQHPALVGVDSLNVDAITDGTRPAHTALLAAGILIVEHVRGLDQLPPRGFRFHAAPVAVAGMGTFPIRAYAVIDG